MHERTIARDPGPFLARHHSYGLRKQLRENLPEVHHHRFQTCLNHCSFNGVNFRIVGNTHIASHHICELHIGR